MDIYSVSKRSGSKGKKSANKGKRRVKRTKRMRTKRNSKRVSRRRNVKNVKRKSRRQTKRGVNRSRTKRVNRRSRGGGPVLPFLTPRSKSYRDCGDHFNLQYVIDHMENYPGFVMPSTANPLPVYSNDTHPPEDGLCIDATGKKASVFMFNPEHLASAGRYRDRDSLVKLKDLLEAQQRRELGEVYKTVVKNIKFNNLCLYPGWPGDPSQAAELMAQEERARIDQTVALPMMKTQGNVSSADALVDREELEKFKDRANALLAKEALIQTSAMNDLDAFIRQLYKTDKRIVSGKRVPAQDIRKILEPEIVEALQAELMVAGQEQSLNFSKYFEKALLDSIKDKVETLLDEHAALLASSTLKRASKQKKKDLLEETSLLDMAILELVDMGTQWPQAQEFGSGGEKTFREAVDDVMDDAQFFGIPFSLTGTLKTLRAGQVDGDQFASRWYGAQDQGYWKELVKGIDKPLRNKLLKGSPSFWKLFIGVDAYGVAEGHMGAAVIMRQIDTWAGRPA